MEICQAELHSEQLPLGQISLSPPEGEAEAGEDSSLGGLCSLHTSFSSPANNHSLSITWVLQKGRSSSRWGGHISPTLPFALALREKLIFLLCS